MKTFRFMKKVYQPIGYADDGITISYGTIPKELHSFQAFESREDCEAWLENNGYETGEWAIIEYEEEDIEDLQIIDVY